MANDHTFYITDAAEEIALLIEKEELKLEKAIQKQNEHEPEKKGEEPNSKFKGANRDKNRAKTSIIAYKQALRIVLLTQACTKHGSPQEMPDPDEFLMRRRRLPIV